MDAFIEENMEMAETEYRRLESTLDEMGLDYQTEMALIKDKIAEAGERLCSNLNWSQKPSRVSLETSYTAPKLGISGARIDLVCNEHPVEVKAGNACTTSPFHVLQLTWYSLILEHHFGIDVDMSKSSSSERYPKSLFKSAMKFGLGQ